MAAVFDHYETRLKSDLMVGWFVLVLGLVFVFFSTYSLLSLFYEEIVYYFFEHTVYLYCFYTSIYDNVVEVLDFEFNCE